MNHEYTPNTPNQTDQQRRLESAFSRILYLPTANRRTCASARADSNQSRWVYPTLRSPITYAAEVNAPILIIQGRNDSNTPPRTVVAYEAALSALGKEIEVVWCDGGHMGSVTNVEQGIEHQEMMLNFAQRVLPQR